MSVPPSYNCIMLPSRYKFKYMSQDQKPECYEQQWHTQNVGHCIFNVPQCYQIIKFIGSGAYGSVALGTNRSGDTKLAIKKLIRPFQDIVTIKRTYRELKLLQTLNNQESGVIELIDAFSPDSSVELFESIYLVFPYVPYDLNKVIQSGLLESEDQIRLIIYSIIRSLKYIHSAGIIHRDLKPSNIGLDDDLNTYILDFGLARQSQSEMMTGYVATRWWRAPELLFNPTHYDATADIWSVGCIMGEIIKGQPIFPGSSQKVTPPDSEQLRLHFDPSAINYIEKQREIERKPFSEIFSTLSPHGVSLLESLLKLNPSERPTAEKALEHPFFEEYHLPEDEPTADTFNDPYEGKILCMRGWKELIFKMVKSFNKSKTI
ncbi:hypothetical protein ACOME3_010230 [Neoechinorhynchus agilis]